MSIPTVSTRHSRRTRDAFALFGEVLGEFSAFVEPFIAPAREIHRPEKQVRLGSIRIENGKCIKPFL